MPTILLRIPSRRSTELMKEINDHGSNNGWEVKLLNNNPIYVPGLRWHERVKVRCELLRVEEMIAHVMLFLDAEVKFEEEDQLLVEECHVDSSV